MVGRGTAAGRLAAPGTAGGGHRAQAPGPGQRALFLEAPENAAQARPPSPHLRTVSDPGQDSHPGNLKLGLL